VLNDFIILGAVNPSNLKNMSQTTLREILRQNVLELLSRDKPFRAGETGVMRLKALGFSNGTAQRVIEGSTSVGIDTVEELALRLGVSSWRLLQPKDGELGMKVNITTDVDGIAMLFASLSTDERAAIHLLIKRIASLHHPISKSSRKRD
jgi:hypothetical protein